MQTIKVVINLLAWERHIEELSNIYESECNHQRSKYGLKPSDTCDGECMKTCKLLKDEEVR